ncbi:uncharacterized protein BX663DRAFT_504774 [Cokeromyces recurvatus]|uniref:uncharacterized protein n=1 Tax=Cokeromyces recurvatus TaxID=90255 RepID=UPI00221E718E|nr:uncharacterized protein BX663DRAFT_504774 [Cokeromyces recurvatus]KAI7904354.1 hypothetical protein BX663DRAFT_504774 [Cokeromyces recurvatus]
MNTMTQQQQQQQHHHHQLNSDSEQPKKKRGRKKRDSLPVASLCNQPTLLAPKPLAPRPPESIPPIIKQEPIIVPLISHTTPSPNHPHQEDAQKVAQIQKRQERLIKNRAAALLSRKRKREHLTQLEEEKQKLLVENERLQSQLTLLETKLENLEKENLELKEKLKEKETTTTIIQMSHQQQQQQHLQQHLQHKKQHDILQKPTTKATGVVFMIILFSFALFTLPTRSSVNRLTVGGSGLLEKNQFPLIDSSSMLPPIMKEEGREEIPTDLVLLDSVRPRDLQTWINNHKLVDQQKSLMTSDNSNNHVYLYDFTFISL